MAAKDMPWFQSSKESGDPRTWIALASCLLFRTGAPLNPANYAIESYNKDGMTSNLVIRTRCSL